MFEACSFFGGSNHKIKSETWFFRMVSSPPPRTLVFLCSRLVSLTELRLVFSGANFTELGVDLKSRPFLGSNEWRYPSMGC